MKTYTVKVTYLYVGEEATPTYTDGRYKTDIYGAVVDPETAATLSQRNPKIKVGEANLAILASALVGYSSLGAVRVELPEVERKQAEVKLIEIMIRNKYKDYSLKFLKAELAKRL